MGIYEFNALSDDEKKTVVTEKGVELSRRKDGDFEFVLYYIDSFYVEAKFAIEPVLKECKSFNSPHLLDPYLGDIDITDL